MDARGFTLIELLVVLAILALIGGGAVAVLSRPPAGADLAAAARGIEADLRSARSEAIRHNRPTALVIDLGRRVVGIEGSGAARALPPAVTVSLTTARSAVLGERVGRIVFFPDGTATGGGVVLGQGGREQRVLVDWLTGRVTVPR